MKLKINLPDEFKGAVVDYDHKLPVFIYGMKQGVATVSPEMEADISFFDRGKQQFYDSLEQLLELGIVAAITEREGDLITGICLKEFSIRYKPNAVIRNILKQNKNIEMSEIVNNGENENHNIRSIVTINVTGEDMQALVRIRNYFGESDKNQIERMAYDVLDRVVKPFVSYEELIHDHDKNKL